jgi:hypothetical protein
MDNIYALMQRSLYGDVLRKNLHLFVEHFTEYDKQSPGTARNSLMYLSYAVKFLQGTGFGISDSIKDIDYHQSFTRIECIRKQLNKSQNHRSSEKKSREKLIEYKHWPADERLQTLQNYVLKVQQTMMELNDKAIKTKQINSKEYLFALRYIFELY